MSYKEPKFYNKDGSLTLYSLACGYIQVKEDNRHSVKLYQDGCFHVKSFTSNDMDSWESFDTLTEARKAFKKEIKERGIK